MSVRPHHPSGGDRPFPRLNDGVHHVNLGNGSAFDILIQRGTRSDGRSFIGVVGCGLWHFSGEWVHASYVNEKLFADKWQADAENIADFIFCQFAPGVPDLGWQGTYLIDLTA